MDCEYCWWRLVVNYPKGLRVGDPVGVFVRILHSDGVILQLVYFLQKVVSFAREHR